MSPLARARDGCSAAMSDWQPQMPPNGSAGAAAPRIGILIVAYNAATTLAQVLDRVPPAFRPRVTRIFVCDDASEDSTYLVGLGYKQLTPDMPLTVIRHPDNLGYGGNQKAGYRLAIEHDLDIVVLLHGDGQYAPECLAEIVAPLERDECDAVLGSRMMVKGAARRGGMPLYKYVGNKLLSRFQNRVLGTSLSEFHSGYRAYRVSALQSIPFEGNSDGFNFDTQIIIQLHDAGKRILEVPIPTYYGDEICYVNGFRYARDCVADVVRYRLAKIGFSSEAVVDVGEQYALKEGEGSSHSVISGWLRELPVGRLLDLGCAGGLVAERARALGHHVVGVDLLEQDGARARVDRLILANLDAGLPPEVEEEGPFDIILAGDVLEHVRHPSLVLEQAHRLLRPRGALIVSVPNFAHWYVRVRAMFGIIDYDRRGILDRTHVRFFTRRSIERDLRGAGFQPVRRHVTGLPLDVLARGRGRFSNALRLLDRAMVGIRPTLFGYQFLYHCAVAPTSVPVDSSSPARERGVPARD
jgi:2-polyprenyl-3-methyl-5-hydroxy-6-metoxy-1,4-benzoquinol methylase